MPKFTLEKLNIHFNSHAKVKLLKHPKSCRFDKNRLPKKKKSISRKKIFFRYFKFKLFQERFLSQSLISVKNNKLEKNIFCKIKLQKFLLSKKKPLTLFYSNGLFL
jgi:hypothetical protein